MNRAELQQLAEDRILDAAALLAAGRWSAAYYLAGYAVECALKACIAKLTSQHDFPPKVKYVQDCYTHDLEKLLKAAGRKLGSCEGLGGDESLRTEDPGAGPDALRRPQRPGWDTPMDTVTLVNEHIDDGERLIKQLPQEGFEVTAAFWLKAAEDGAWHFYLVSPVVEAEGLAQAYMRLHPLIRRMPPPFWIDPLEVKLIGPADPIAQDVLAVHSRAGGPPVCPIRWGAKKLGNGSIEAAYFYPLPRVVPG